MVARKQIDGGMSSKWLVGVGVLSLLFTVVQVARAQSSDGDAWSTGRSTSPYAEFTAKLSFGMLGSFGGSALDGFDQTGLRGGRSYAAWLRYGRPHGIGLKVGVSTSSLELWESGAPGEPEGDAPRTSAADPAAIFGNVSSSQLGILFSYSARAGGPGGKSRLGFYIDAGIGVAFASFENGPFIRELSSEFGVPISARVDDTLGVQLAGGIDVRLSKSFGAFAELGAFSAKSELAFVAGGAGNPIQVTFLSADMNMNTSHLRVGVNANLTNLFTSS